jgi:hypothetical protein
MSSSGNPQNDNGDNTEQNPGPAPLPSRRFFSSRNTADEFYERFDTYVTEQTEQFRQLNANFAQLASAIDRLTRLQLQAAGQQTSTPSSTRDRSPPRTEPNAPVPLQNPLETSGSHPEHSEQVPPMSPRPPPAPRPGERTMSLPREITEPPGPSPSNNPIPEQPGRITGLKPQIFHGRDGENVLFWLQQLEMFFRIYNVPEEYKPYYGSFSITGDAANYFQYLVGTNQGLVPTWEEFRRSFIAKYENQLARDETLRQKLTQVFFKGISHMAEYCEQFRYYESQIYDMAFPDRLGHFLAKLPIGAALHIRNLNLSTRDMELVYRAANQWAANVRSTINLRVRRPPPEKFPRFAKTPPTKLRLPVAPTTKQDRPSEGDDDFDFMEEMEELNKMDLAQVTCFNCNKVGHFARNCKNPPAKSKAPQKRQFGKPSKTLFQTVETAADYGFDEDGNELYEVFEPNNDDITHDPHEGEEEDVLNFMFLAPTTEQPHLLSTYSLNEESTVVTTPESRRLPIYDSILEGKEKSKTVIDSGATTIYLREALAEQLGLKITRVTPRTVIIADKDKVVVSGVVSLKMQLEGLPPEQITAYTFPLGSVDLILGLSWLQKHNPHTDWRTGTYEFTRNGRRYMLHPRKPPTRIPVTPNSPSDPSTSPTINIVSPEEFRMFIDGSTSLFLITKSMLSDNPSEEPPKPPRKLLRWIKRKCPDLLREMGRPANLEPFDIDIGDHPPIKVNPRPHSPLDLQKIKEFIDENLKNGIISESDSPWSFPLVLAAKPDGGTRVCVDYRALNRITRKDAHPIPRIDESLLRFFGMKYFTHIDLRSGYWQIPLTPLSRAKTAFSSRYGHYEFNVIPFGLSNAPGAFQRRMNKVLRQFLDKFCIVYLDDILIFSRTKQEHQQHVKAVLKALNNAGMILNLKKCKFFAREVRFLGHLINENGSRPDKKKIEKILSWPTPRNITDVRGFCNLVNVYRKYIPKLADKMAPLTDLMRGSPPKGAAIQWSGKEEDSFQLLKKLVTSEPVVKHPKIGEPFYIDPDSSQLAIGAVLQQYFPDPDGKERLHPIAFESKKLSETEQRYSTQERELLAAKYALDHWRYIIEGSPIIIRSDHESLKTFRTKNPMTRRLTRFINDIEHFNPTFMYRPGRLQKVPDALSRRPGLKEEGKPADSSEFYAVETDPVPKPREVAFYDRILQHLQGKPDKDLITEFKDKDISELYELRDGILYNKRLNSPVVFSASHLKDVLELVHKDLGHYGKQVTFDGLKRRYEVAMDVSWKEGESLLDSCVPCQLYRPTPADTPRIHPYSIKNPFEMWEIDFVGPLVETSNGNKYLITAIDYSTAKALAYPLPDRSSEAAIELLEDIVWSFGKPAQIVHDNGEEFKSKQFQAACQRYRIRSTPTTPGHPQTNGKVERLNHELIQRLQRISAEEGHRIQDWDLYLRQALFAFHAHVNSRHGATSFYLQYGVEPVLPSSSISSKPITRVELDEALEHRRKHIQNLLKHRNEAAEKYKDAMQCLAQKRKEYMSKTWISNGDLVMRSVLNQKSKLHPRWDGPFIVVGSTDKDTHQLASANGYTLRNLVNQARLRKLSPSEITKYTREFWEASERLKLYDRRAKETAELQELDKQIKQATIDVLEAQKHGKPVPLKRHAELAAQKKKITSVQADMAAATTMPADPAHDSTSRHANASLSAPSSGLVPPSRYPTRLRRLPVRYFS